MAHLCKIIVLYRVDRVGCEHRIWIGNQRFTLLDVALFKAENFCKGVVFYWTIQLCGKRAAINTILNYPEDSAGSIMTLEYVSLAPTMTIGDALKKIKSIGAKFVQECNVQNDEQMDDLFTKKRITPSAFLGKMGYLEGNLHKKVIPVLWNLLDSHDTPRFLHRCGEDVEKFKTAVALQLLWPGMPFIYYGDEYGFN